MEEYTDEQAMSIAQNRLDFAKEIAKDFPDNKFVHNYGKNEDGTSFGMNCGKNKYGEICISETVYDFSNGGYYITQRYGVLCQNGSFEFSQCEGESQPDAPLTWFYAATQSNGNSFVSHTSEECVNVCCSVANKVINGITDFYHPNGAEEDVQ